MKPLRQLAWIFLLLAGGWGVAGHDIIARIAEDRLSPDAKKRLAEILAADETEPNHVSISDDYVGNWADIIKKSNGTAWWHFVDIPYEEQMYDAKRDCFHDEQGQKKPGCLIDQLEAQRAILNDRTASLKDRERALKYVVHLVGDIHQPLHCANYNDRGGNDRKIEYFAALKPFDQNLHAFWDFVLIDEALGHDASHDNVLKYADGLAARIDDKEAKTWLTEMTCEVRANQTHLFAREQVYKGVDPDKTKVVKITKEDVTALTPAMESQLQKAGVRLAAVLEEAAR